MTLPDRKIYPSLDIAKFVMAMLILLQHTSNEWAHSTGFLHALFGLGNFAVPFFFACSGLLFFAKYDTLDAAGKCAYYRRWSLRIGKMYLVWSAIYFVFVVNSWFAGGFGWLRPLQWLHRAAVFSTYATIWFLPALWLGVTICRWLRERFGTAATAAVLAAAYVVGNLFGSFSNVVTLVPAVESFYRWYMTVFITWRNGVFNGAPFVFIGMMIAAGKCLRLRLSANIALTAVFGAAFLAEAYCIIKYRLGTATDMGFMMGPAILFMMQALTQMSVKPRAAWIHCRNMSMLIFLGQRLFLSALPGIMPPMAAWLHTLPQPAIFAYFTTVAVGFAIVIERLSDRFKFLKILW